MILSAQSIRSIWPSILEPFVEDKVTGVAIVDRYRVAAQDVRGIEGRN